MLLIRIRRFRGRVVDRGVGVVTVIGYYFVSGDSEEEWWIKVWEEFSSTLSTPCRS